MALGAYLEVPEITELFTNSRGFVTIFLTNEEKKGYQTEKIRMKESSNANRYPSYSGFSPQIPMGMMNPMANMPMYPNMPPMGFNNGIMANNLGQGQVADPQSRPHPHYHPHRGGHNQRPHFQAKLN